jgi:hypothetical protein
LVTETDYQGNQVGSSNVDSDQDGNLLKKCDLEESSYGTFEIAAGLKAVS